MHVRRLVAGLVVTAAALTTTAGPAAAAPRTPTTEADLIGVVRIDPTDPTVATVKARYRCTGEGSLWVSVKQTPDRTADPRLTQEGSSTISAAYSDSHRNPVTCTGKWQTQTFTVDQVEVPPPGSPWVRGGQGPLAKGEGYVQFCLFDDNFPMPQGPEGHGEPLSRNEFLHVRA
jgi:hypothetical protein